MSTDTPKNFWWWVGAIVVGIFALRKGADDAAAVEEETVAAVASGGTIDVRLTGYWPFVEGLSAAQRLMEGGIKDRKGKPLHTLEDHLADPGAHPYVSVSGDDAVFPYGQRLVISAWPGAVFRVVDTGGHFRGAGKVYRVLGREPLDICVASSSTVVPKDGTTATIVSGDNFAGGKSVNASNLQGQSIV